MAREEKVKAVEELAGLLSQSELVVVTDYRGLTVSDLAKLRGRLRQQGVEYRVTKNTLTGLAAEKVGKQALKQVLVGPTAIAFGGQDMAALSKVLGEFERTSKVFKVRGGLLGQERVLAATEVAYLATLPSKAQLIAQVMAGFQSPIAGLVGVLSGVLGGLVGTLEARRVQLEQQGAA